MTVVCASGLGQPGGKVAETYALGPQCLWALQCHPLAEVTLSFQRCRPVTAAPRCLSLTPSIQSEVQYPDPTHLIATSWHLHDCHHSLFLLS